MWNDDAERHVLRTQRFQLTSQMIENSVEFGQEMQSGTMSRRTKKYEIWTSAPAAEDLQI